MQHIFQYLCQLKQKLLSEVSKTQQTMQGAGALSLWPLEAEPQSLTLARAGSQTTAFLTLLSVQKQLFLPHSFHFSTQ